MFVTKLEISLLNSPRVYNRIIWGRGGGSSSSLERIENGFFREQYPYSFLEFRGKRCVIIRIMLVDAAYVVSWSFMEILC
jgi:hypothetical protein